MSLLSKLFSPPPAIADTVGLARFIDEHAAFLVQKGIYEYSRARAGHYAKVLFSEQPFLEALERSRWGAYPLGIAMVTELVEGVLRPHAGEARLEQLAALRDLALAVFDRYPTPAAMGEPAWREARAGLERRLQLIGLHPPKRAFEIPDPFARDYFDLMPIHKKLRASEFPTLHNYLKVTLCNIHEALTRRLDAPGVAAALAGRARTPEPLGGP